MLVILIVMIVGIAIISGNSSNNSRIVEKIMYCCLSSLREVSSRLAATLTGS